MTLALALRAGCVLGDVEAIGLALGVAVLAAVAWAQGSRSGSRIDIGYGRTKGASRDLGATASKLDGRLGLGGGFLAAFEASRRGEPSAVAELGAHRVFRSITRARAEAAVVPHSVGFIALPIVAIGFLVTAIDLRSGDALVRKQMIARNRATLADVRQALEGAASPQQTTPQGAAVAALEDAAAAAEEVLADASSTAGERDAAMQELGRALEEAAHAATDGSVSEELRDLALRAEVESGLTDDLADASGADDDSEAATEMAEAFDSSAVAEASNVDGETSPTSEARPGESAPELPEPSAAFDRVDDVSTDDVSTDDVSTDDAAMDGGSKSGSTGESQQGDGVEAEGTSETGGSPAALPDAPSDGTAPDGRGRGATKDGDDDGGVADSASNRSAAAPRPIPRRHRSILRDWLASRRQ